MNVDLKERTHYVLPADLRMMVRSNHGWFMRFRNSAVIG